MAVYIYDENAFEKFVLVEGEEYWEYKSEKEFGDYSFDAFFKQWRKICKRSLWWYRFKRRLSIPFRKYNLGISTPSGNAAIYGLWGWNRYAVRENGEILFIKLLSEYEEDIQKAQKVGFRLC